MPNFENDYIDGLIYGKSMRGIELDTYIEDTIMFFNSLTFNKVSHWYLGFANGLLFVANDTNHKASESLRDVINKVRGLK